MIDSSGCRLQLWLSFKRLRWLSLRSSSAIDRLQRLSFQWLQFPVDERLQWLSFDRLRWLSFQARVAPAVAVVRSIPVAVVRSSCGYRSIDSIVQSTPVLSVVRSSYGYRSIDSDGSPVMSFQWLQWLLFERLQWLSFNDSSGSRGSCCSIDFGCRSTPVTLFQCLQWLSFDAGAVFQWLSGCWSSGSCGCCLVLQ